MHIEFYFAASYAWHTQRIQSKVFSCVSATCGRFYHPQCVAKLLHRENESAAEELQKKISAGESFICPIHKCCICKQGENKKDPELQFAVCRRCPKSYHRKCLPRKIAFEDLEEEDIIQRAWEGLLPNRILIYCLKHEIDEEIGTPIRKHIKFPDVEKKKNIASEMPLGKEKGMLKKRSLASEDSPRERTAMKAPKQVEKLSSALKEDPLIKSRATDASRKSSRDNVKSVSVKADKSSTADENKISLGERLYNLMSKGKQDTDDGDLDRMVAVKPAMKKSNSSPHRLDADSERRLLALMKESKSSITLEKVIEKHKVPSTHAYQSKNVVDKTITQGKVEGAVEAVRTALQKLEAGCSIEDAKAVCEPEVLQHIVRWQSKLKVYLAPFLHGMRYTSFGRHFTKVEKLEAIVEKLHWYVQNGDMIVDFCCGANDFSWLMKRKLEETGKKCSYKNYDVIQPKNDFNFEKRDWMEVRPGELPIGSQLIMGLNPPFGVHAALANKFIDKALEFKPKLLILIVPPETERLDKKKSPYDLVWEDDELLSGKSFYLPGSVDVNDKQMDQWNKTPPPLYLWSRHDWTTKHKALAQKHGHLSRQQKELHLEENLFETQVPHDGDVPMLMDDHPVQNGEPELERIAIVTEGRKASSPRELERRAIATEGRKASSPRELERAAVPDSRKTGSPRDNVGKEGHENHGNGNNQSRENSKKRRRGKGQRGRGTDGVSSEEKQKGGRPPVREVHRGIPHHSPPNVTDGRSSLEGYPSNSPVMPSHREVREDAYRHFEPSISGSGSQFGTGYGITQASIPDDMARRYNLNSEQPYSTGTHRWSSGASPGQGPNSVGYRPYFSAIDEKYGMNLDTQSHFPHFGRQDPDSSTQRSSYLAGHDPGYGHVGPFSSTYLNLGSASQSSYSRMNTSTMDRYAPRLDELNPARISTLGSDPPMGSMNGMYDPRVPPPRFRADAMGFAPGPHHGFSHQSSSGWLNE
ncbi:hypothetical protein L1049_000391 [Liquidambar formosana]|uniref:Uncharacterized protein n=1 Tax=Liquidambar formosana TaxID=63359 RepID=A0AAP0R567_LIQFO